MKVRIKRVDKSLPLPKYETPGACCFDLLAREQTVIQPKSLGLIPSNIIIEVPKGYMFVVVPRSSTPKKKGLLIPHGIGVIDQDYHGPEDEVWFQVYNFTDEAVTIEKGDRVSQGCLIPIVRAEFEEFEDDIKDQSRGGRGSTG